MSYCCSIFSRTSLNQINLMTMMVIQRITAVSEVSSLTCLGPRWRDVYEGKLIMDNDVWLRKKNGGTKICIYEHWTRVEFFVGLAICEHVSCERPRSTQIQIMRSKNMHLEQAEKKITENTLFLNYLILAFNIWIWLNLINLPAQLSCSFSASSQLPRQFQHLGRWPSLCPRQWWPLQSVHWALVWSACRWSWPLNF